MFDVVKNMNSNSKVCQKYKNPKPKLVVSFPLARNFNGKHSAVVVYTVTKTMEDGGCDLELALSWAVAAKNSLKNVNGFSLNVFGGNPNYPTALNSIISSFRRKIIH